MNLQSVDLNLLKVFEAVAEERSTTLAGARVGLTQSSVSNALSRLRTVFGDELFVRTPQGMMPTPRAEQLVAPVQSALNRLRAAMADSEGFDPISATGTVRIATSDLQVMVVGAKLARAISRSAPAVELQFSQLDKRSVFADLDEDRVDLAISSYFDKPRRFNASPFGSAKFLCIGRVGHPAFERGLSLADYVAFPHVMVSFRADATSMLDTELAKRGLIRRVGVTVGDFLGLPPVLAGSDYLASIPTYGSRLLTAPGTCMTMPLPFDMPAWPMEMIWSRRADADPLQGWARSVLQSIGPA